VQPAHLRLYAVAPDVPALMALAERAAA
jgi:hypothetical protein